MQDNLKNRIAEGEHQRLEFKFEVSDFRKIARTLVAFSNTDGGSLLIGVKDNGMISGVRSEEEFFMVDGAAKIYCKPEVRFKVREWQAEGKRVLEFIIEEGKVKPYLAQDEEGEWIAYLRQGEHNFRTSNVMLKVWKKQSAAESVTIRFRQPERLLLNFLELQKVITISKFRRIAGLSATEAEDILAGFIMLDIIRAEHSLSTVTFRLTEGYKRIVERLTRESGEVY